jgi:hypothetical protein
MSKTETTIPTEFVKRALEWRQAHRTHIAKLVATAKGSFAPCHEDMRRPELWKAESWKWLASMEDAETHGQS